MNEIPVSDLSKKCWPIKVEAFWIIELRHKVLRPGLPLETARFEGDELPSTFHFALEYPVPPIETANTVCCVSFMLNPFRGETAYQLRGMATDPEHQKKGFGSVLLEVAESVVAKTGIQLFWCNARIVAVPFYKKHGWQVVGDVFEIKGVGQHYVMTKKL
jgi:GNAT superfamily N-acetyltransferase